LRRNGEEFPVELSISAVRVGDRWNAVGIVRDISNQTHIEERLRHLSLTVEQSPASIVMTSLDATIEYVNNAFVAISGYSREEAIGQNSRILQSGRTPPETYQSLWETLTQGRTWVGELYNKHRNGTEYIELATISPLRNEDGTIVKYVAVKEDITARKAAEADALHLAFFDQLTNLPNRRLLLDRLEKAILVSARNHRPGALIYIDLDNFKSLNDTLGHDIGDQLLRLVGIRLVSCVRASDTVARFGGDEFVVMIEDLEETLDASIAQAAVVGNKILQSMNEAFQLDDHTHNNSASIGIAMFTGQETSSAELLKQADIAMYSAKESGRNAVRFFDTRMQERVVAQAAIESDLRQALVSNRFQLYYQPKMDSDGHIAGAEALLRLNHPLNGIIAPDSFVPIAEKSGLILQIGDWVLNDACAQLARWSTDSKLNQMTLAVNVSARQFSEPSFVQSVLGALERSRANPKRLILELTESMLVGSYEPIVNKMAALRAHGIRFALDDFGTGYSSLAYLNRLSLDQLKIDMSFVNGVPHDPNACAIVRTIIALGKALNLRVIAEGVETRAQLDFLTDAGCNLYQGYFFGRPLSLGAFNALVNSGVVSDINASFQTNDAASGA
jgi:diguanylate cyclase (GGDEF)-like protein/PAS domain S-box-containing protein